MPENWKTYKLKDVALLKRGYDLPSRLRKPGNYDIISSSGVTDKHEAYKIKGPGVVTGRYGTIGKVFYSESNFWPLNTSLYVKDFKGNDPKFIYFLLQTLNWKKYSTKSAVPGVDRNEVHQEQVIVPALAEQKSIASILSALNDKIELNLRTNKTLEEIAMALYKHWFVDFGPFQEGKFVDSELGEIPKGWEVKNLEDEFKITIGRTPPRKEKEWFSSVNGVKWISIKDMGNCGTYIFNTSEFLTKEAVVKKNVPQVPENTVILSFKLTVGRVAITTENMVTNEAIAHFLKKKNTILSSEYLYSALKSFDYNSLGSTSSIATAVNSKTVKSMKILVPSKSVLDNFQQEIISFFELIKINSKEIQTLTQLRDTLLPKLISGEVRVKDVEKTLSEV